MIDFEIFLFGKRREETIEDWIRNERATKDDEGFPVIVVVVGIDIWVEDGEMIFINWFNHSKS